MSIKYSTLFPMRLVLLDLVGFVLLIIGVAEWLTQAGVVPELLRFKFHDLILIGLGVVLMLPLLVNIIFEYRRSSSANDPP